MKKKILIISYFLEPCNSIAVRRAQSIINTLQNDEEYELFVVTRHWSGEEKKWDDYLASTKEKEIKKEIKNNATFFYLPFISKASQKQSFKSKVQLFINYLKGSILPDTTQFFSYIEENIDLKTIDFIYVSVAPDSLCKLAYQLHQKYNTPYVVDFRDFHNQITLKKDSKLKINRFFILHTIKVQHMKKWLSKTVAMFTISPPITEYVNKHFKNNCVTITHGYEEEEFCKIRKMDSHTENFNMTVIGTIYEEQDTTVIIEALKMFFEKYPMAKFKINLIGVELVPVVAEKFRKNLPSGNYIITDRIHRDKALEIGQKSDVLFYAGWKGYKGVYSGKIFEYLGLRKNILIAPNDHDVIEELLIETNAGKATDTPEQTFEVIENWYKEWLDNNSQLKYDGDIEKIQRYTRKNQTYTMLDIIDDSIKKVRILIKNQ